MRILLNLYREYMLISPLHQSEGHKKGLVATVRPLRPQVSSLFKSIFLKTINLDSRSKWPLCLCTFSKFKFVVTAKWRKNSVDNFLKPLQSNLTLCNAILSFPLNSADFWPRPNVLMHQSLGGPKWAEFGWFRPILDPCNKIFGLEFLRKIFVRF